MSRPIETVSLNSKIKERLSGIVKSVESSLRMKKRAQVILFRAAGNSQEETATQLNVSRVTVSKWTQRFLEEGSNGLTDKPGRGRKPNPKKDIKKYKNKGFEWEEIQEIFAERGYKKSYIGKIIIDLIREKKRGSKQRLSHS